LVGIGLAFASWHRSSLITSPDLLYRTNRI
jgi:hypothetical protein